YFSSAPMQRQPGTYVVPSTYDPDAGSGGLTAGGRLHIMDERCDDVQPFTDAWADSGNVTLTRVDSTIAGTLHLVFTDGELDGACRVPSCEYVEDGGLGGNCP